MLKRNKKEECSFTPSKLEVEYIATIYDFREDLVGGGRKKKNDIYNKNKHISLAKIKIQKETEVSCFNC